MKESISAQCVHNFQIDPTAEQVRCRKCGDLDDEMQLFNKGELLMDIQKRKKELFESSQVSFE